MTLRRALAAPPPASGAAVMATGIVSLALRAEGVTVASAVLMWLAAAVWVALVVALVAGPMRESREPGVLTMPAGTCVLGSRLTANGWRPAGIVLLVAGALQWALLMPRVLRAWRTPTVGASFLTTVSTAALAVLALALRAQWLRPVAWVLVALAAALYAFVLARFDLGQLLDGAGDQWVAGGGLAILALALAPLSAPLADAAWVGASAWLPALVIAELARPRLRFDVRRFATVFPLGMYAVASFATGHATVGHVFVWIAAGAWLATLGLAAR